MSFLLLKAIHLVFAVTWFAGLFYIVRLFVYHSEALQKDEPERSILTRQLSIMEKRLWYGITWPSAILISAIGVWLAITTGSFSHGWFHIKLALLVLLLAYHTACHLLFLKFQRNISPWNPSRLRLWNELATLLLVAIVFIAVFRNAADLVKGIAGLVILSVLLVLGIRLYKKIRDKK